MNMIKIQYVCDKCGGFNPYVPSKASVITCMSCHHVEDIPMPTKLEKEKEG
jgi:hypothetical protein